MTHREVFEGSPEGVIPHAWFPIGFECSGQLR